MSRAPILRYSLVAVALVGACFSIVLGVASFLFHRGDRSSVELAARLVPFNSEYLARLSSYYPSRRTELLKKAAADNPYSEQAWIDLGVDAEFYRHDDAAAERYYLKAADVSQLFLPRWTLANFYFRQQNEPQFSHWAHLALEVTPYTAAPLFSEMWVINPDHARIVAGLPNRPAILQQYFDFLMTTRQYAFVPAVVKRLVSSAPPSDARLYGIDGDIGPALDILLGAGYAQEALQVWSELSGAHWIRFPVPSPRSPLTNGDFDRLYGHGFDWFLLNPNGVSMAYNEGVHEIEMDFSGDEAEQCQLLMEWLPLGPSRGYHLQWEEDSSEIATPSGVTWRLHSTTFDLQSPDLIGAQAAGWDFKTPAGAGLAILNLEYHRPLGQTRAQGTIRLRKVSLRPN